MRGMPTDISWKIRLRCNISVDWRPDSRLMIPRYLACGGDILRELSMVAASSVGASSSYVSFLPTLDNPISHSH